LNGAAGQGTEPGIYGNCIGFFMVEVVLVANKSRLNFDKEPYFVQVILPDMRLFVLFLTIGAIQSQAKTG
jgi:hypothetical protein